MARQIEITTRQRQILTTIVDSYISTGEPVSSGAIARMFALGSASMSPATVRSEMAELADAGLLEQPHTSAGRVPSAQAFRVYVEGLHDNRAQLPSASQAEVQGHIDSSFAGLAGPQALLARTSHVLAVLSSGGRRGHWSGNHRRSARTCALQQVGNEDRPRSAGYPWRHCSRPRAFRRSRSLVAGA